MPYNSRSIDFKGVKISCIQFDETVNFVEELVKKNDYGNFIVIANANDTVECINDPEVREATNQSSLTVADGFSLLLLLRMFGYRLQRRVYGPDLMLEILRVSQEKGYSNFFYGATVEILAALTKNIRKLFPGINISGSYAPPFEAEVRFNTEVAQLINKASPDILWVGLGCPKQQIWMYKYKGKLNVPVMVGVGAAFDFLSGTKPQAPRWMRDNGLEWLFRLLSEPRRLWRRYLIYGSKFLFYAFKELIKKRKNV